MGCACYGLVWQLSGWAMGSNGHCPGLAIGCVGHELRSPCPGLNMGCCDNGLGWSQLIWAWAALARSLAKNKGFYIISITGRETGSI